MNLREKLIGIASYTQNDVKKLIVKKLLDSFYQNKYLSIQEMSQQCFISKSAISKFSKTLGYSGYRELIVRLKLERETYVELLDKHIELQNFHDTQDFFIEYIKYLEIYENDIKKIIELMKQSKTIIVASRQLIEQAKILFFYLKQKQFDVNFTELVVPNYNVDLNQTNINILFMVGGMEVDEIFELYNNIKQKNNVIFFTSYALSNRIDKYDVKIIYDKENVSLSIYVRNVIVGYLIAQIIKMVY